MSNKVREVKESPIGSEINYLRDEKIALKELVNELEKRLEWCLSPDTPKEAPPKPEEDNLAPLASVIRGLRKDLEVLSGQLRVILERLAL
jgi:hypothetical protein